MTGFLKLVRVGQEMLKKGSLFLLLFLVGCATSDNSNSYLRMSQKVIGIRSYNTNYNLIQDTLRNWIDNLPSFAFFKKSKWKLDSLVCYDKTGTKLKSCLLTQCIQSNCTMDDLHYLYGVKIRGSWYYFLGPTIYLPREAYSGDAKNPLTFEKLHDIAMNEIFHGYIINGEINDKFFSSLNKNAGGFDYTTREAWEKTYLNLVGQNWRKRDSITNVNLP